MNKALVAQKLQLIQFSWLKHLNYFGAVMLFAYPD